MNKICYICNKIIEEDEEYDYKELYGYSHKNCVMAKGCIITKEFNVKKFKKQVKSEDLSEEQVKEIIEKNTIDEFEE
jgi:hypothetical protein